MIFFRKNNLLTIDSLFLSLDQEKKESLTFWDKYVLRIPSYYVSYVLYNYFNLSANSVSVVSAILAIIGFLLVFYSPIENFIIMLLFLNLWTLLDCSDGNIARALSLKYNMRNSYGELYDALSGYVVLAGLWITVGFYLMRTNGEELYFLLGALSSILALFARMVNLRLILENGIGCSLKKKSRLYQLWENFEIGSFMMPLIFISYHYDFLKQVFIFYLLINVALTTYSLVKVMLYSRDES